MRGTVSTFSVSAYATPVAERDVTPRDGPQAALDGRPPALCLSSVQ